MFYSVEREPFLRGFSASLLGAGEELRELNFISHDRHGHRRAARGALVAVFPDSRPRSSKRAEIMASLDRSYATSVEPHGRNFGYLTPWLPAPRHDFRPAPRTADPIPEPAALA